MYPLVSGSDWYSGLLGLAADLQGRTLALASYQDSRSDLKEEASASVKLCLEQTDFTMVGSDFLGLSLLFLILILEHFSLMLLVFKLFSFDSLLMEFLAFLAAITVVL